MLSPSKLKKIQFLQTSPDNTLKQTGSHYYHHRLETQAAQYVGIFEPHFFLLTRNFFYRDLKRRVALDLDLIVH